MATGSKVYTIQQGTPITAPTGITFLGIGSDGTPGAKRILTHPTSTLAPITYYSNPKRTINLDNDVLTTPNASVVRAITGSKLLRFEQTIADVVVQELWPGSDKTFAMPTFFFRQLYEYLINPPAFSASIPVYITWEPRDRSTKTFNVEIVNMLVGGQENNLDVLDVIAKGGVDDGGTIRNATDGINVLPGGLVDRDVTLIMKIVSEV